MHAGESYPASGLSVEITPLLLLCGVSAWSLDEQVAISCSLNCSARGGRRARLALLLSLYVVCETLRDQPFAWVPWGVYIGLPPGGTMVIRLGVGPSRL